MSLKILSYPQIPFEGDLPFCFNIVSLLKRGLDLSSNVSARCPFQSGENGMTLSCGYPQDMRTVAEFLLCVLLIKNKLSTLTIAQQLYL